MKKRLLFIFYCLPFIANSQTISPTLPKTPEVTAFNKNIETPVSQYTGVPSISIPLYEIKIKDITVPISLDYHAGGIRVDQEASWVGLGWSLNYGGQISRKTRGAPDEEFFFFGVDNSSSSINYFNQLPLSPSNPEDLGNRMQYITDAKYQKKDYMPDEFYYSILGFSGRFMFSQEKKKFILFPKDDLNIEQFKSPPDQNGTTKALYYWNILLPTGVAVELGKEGFSAQLDPAGIKKPTTAWQIKSIKNTNNQVINYSYENFSYQVTKFLGQSATYYDTYSPNRPSSGLTGLQQTNLVENITNDDSRIKTINFPNGTIEFSTTERVDFPTKALQEIKVLDSKRNLIKKILFSYSYFYGNSFDANIHPFSTISADLKYKRLRLDSISVSGDGVQSLTHRFDYYTNDNLPSKISFSQDHWGFFNGIANTSTSGFIPNLAPRYFTGGDRRVNPALTNIFSLKSITYPEGGKKEFEYENNTASTLNAPRALLDTYQDDNFNEVSESINISSYSRSSFYPSPTTIENGVKVFKKQFVISGGFTAAGYNCQISTNYGISSLEQAMPYSANNVRFSIERINSDGTKTLIKSFNTTDTNYPYPRTGTENSVIQLVDGKYELTVGITYSNPVGSPADNQPYYLNFSVKWRQFDFSKNLINVGGLRIKNIYYKDAYNNIVKQKAYSYVNSDSSLPSPNYTSGRIVSFPQYYRPTAKHIWDAGDSWQYGVNFNSQSILPLENTCGSFAGYEFVDEYDIDRNVPANNLKTSYKFSFSQPYFSQYYPYLNMGMWEPQEWTRGKLLFKKVFKGSSVVYQEDYEYNYWSPHLANQTNEDYVQEINTDLISYQYLAARDYINLPEDFYDNPQPLSDIYKYQLGKNGCLSFKYGAGQHQLAYSCVNCVIFNPICPDYITVPYFLRYSGFDKLKSKTITQIENGNSISSKEEYFYAKTPIHHQITKIVTQSSSGDKFQTSFSYPSDFSSYEPYTTMKSRNIINTVVKEEKYKNDNTFLSSVKTNYKNWGNNIIAPELIETQLGGITDTTLVVYRYDNIGNILSLSRKSGPRENYVWGYAGQNLIANIVNADYSTIESVLGGNSAVIAFRDKPYPSDSEVDNFISTLTNSTALKSASINSYCYKPLAGITKHTDQKGESNTYQYDNLQRLSTVKDHHGNILKSYCYNYAGQQETCPPLAGYTNVQKSQVFTRNNCAAGYTGGQATYTVPAGKYTSSVSQAAADQLALDEIQANGQNHANQTGTCTMTTGTMQLYNNTPGLTGTTTVQLKQGTTTVRTMIFPTGAGASSLFPDIPAGTYTVSVVITGTSTPRRFTLYRYSGDEPGESKSGTSVSFTDISISSAFNVLIVASNP